MDDFRREMSRQRFLKTLLKFSVLISIPVGHFACKDRTRPVDAQPTLLGLTATEYATMNSVGGVILKGGPVENFDAGAILDRYLFARPESLPFTDTLRLLLLVVDSRLAAIFLDLSLTPLSRLEFEEREGRLREWQNSSLSLKRVAYKALRQLSFLLYSSHPRYVKFTGYQPSLRFISFVK